MDLSEIEEAATKIAGAAFTARTVLVLCNEIHRLEALLDEVCALVGVEIGKKNEIKPGVKVLQFPGQDKLN